MKIERASKPREPALEARIAALAARQQGNVTHEQLTALGLGRNAIAYRAGTGALIRVHVGVYAVGYVRTDPLARAAAAVLACGPGAALSHHSAAALWKIIKRYDGPSEVTAATYRTRPGIRVHRSITLTRRDITTQHGIRVTTAARTILDITPTLTDDQLTRAVNDGCATNNLTVNALSDLLARTPEAPGATRLKRLLGDIAPTRSEFEDAFRRFIRRHKLPTVLINTPLCGYHVDALFPEQRLIVELDGYRYHRDPGAFERDRERDATTLQAGYATIRLTWGRLTTTPKREADRLQTILAARHRAPGV